MPKISNRWLLISCLRVGVKLNKVKGTIAIVLALFYDYASLAENTNLVIILE
jgi:hypothetical protein